MQTPYQNHLSIYRKRSPLTQQDITVLHTKSTCSQICRWEKGEHAPPIEILLTYHLLFKISIEDFFPELKKDIAKRLIYQADGHMNAIQPDLFNQKAEHRIHFLKSVITHLTNISS